MIASLLLSLEDSERDAPTPGHAFGDHHHSDTWQPATPHRHTNISHPRSAMPHFSAEPVRTQDGAIAYAACGIWHARRSTISDCFICTSCDCTWPWIPQSDACPDGLPFSMVALRHWQSVIFPLPEFASMLEYAVGVGGS
jgi:hypothetical protein